MDLISTVLSALLFVAFVPGVLLRFPRNASFKVVLLTHAILFAVVTAVVMNYYWRVIREKFGNYGPTCPNGYVPGANQAGQPDCVPTGHATYDASTGFKPNSPPSK
jgi:hypothetical protein